MSWQQSTLPGVWTFTPKIHKDERGYFIESFNHSSLPAELEYVNFVQDNEAKSTYGVTRGLHYQVGDSAQSKLVRCVMGKVLDAIVDIRPNSPSYGQHETFLLTDENKMQVFVPKGFAHGYSVISDMAIFAYKCDNYYDKSAEGHIYPLDATLGINWLLEANEIILSTKDQEAVLFEHHRPFV
jgi:dTDP-4-dehydrorhamnose 3,5-epimerase